MSSEEAVDSALLVEPSDETEPSEETEVERASRRAPPSLPAHSSSSSGSSMVCGCGALRCLQLRREPARSLHRGLKARAPAVLCAAEPVPLGRVAEAKPHRPDGPGCHGRPWHRRPQHFESLPPRGGEAGASSEAQPVGSCPGMEEISTPVLSVPAVVGSASYPLLASRSMTPSSATAADNWLRPSAAQPARAVAHASRGSRGTTATAVFANCAVVDG
jgi:hypothetical protein